MISVRGETGARKRGGKARAKEPIRQDSAQHNEMMQEESNKQSGVLASVRERCEVKGWTVKGGKGGSEGSLWSRSEEMVTMVEAVDGRGRGDHGEKGKTKEENENNIMVGEDVDRGKNQGNERE